MTDNNTGAKYTKAAVDYSPGKATSRCCNCVHYLQGRSCAVVDGDIDPDYWCKEFKVAMRQDADNKRKLAASLALTIGMIRRDSSFKEADHPRDKEGKFSESGGSKLISTTHDVRAVAQHAANQFRQTFPEAHVSVQDWGTDVGKSSYVTVYAKEPESVFKVRQADWEAKKGTKRGPPPGRKFINWEVRVSDHAVGVLRAAQHAGLLSGKTTHDELSALLDKMKSSLPWKQ